MLNSRNHHQFTVRGGESIENVLGITNQQSIALSLYPTDMEGSFDRTRYLGIAYLPKLELLGMLEKAGCARSIRLSVTAESQIIGEIVLHLSHRIVPVTIRPELQIIKSVEFSSSVSDDQAAANASFVYSEATDVAEESDGKAIPPNCVRISVQIDDLVLDHKDNTITYVVTCGSMLSEESVSALHILL